MKSKLKGLAVAILLAGAGQQIFAIQTQGVRGTPIRPPAGDATPPSNLKASVARQFSGRITEIDKQNKTLTIDEKQLGKEILHVAADTRVLRGDENGAWDQLKIGEEVRATARKSGQINRALTIELAR